MVNGVTDAAGTISFNQALSHDTTAPTCWNPGSNGYAGDVYSTDSSGDVSTVTITLPAGTQAFYLYAEPNTKTPLTVTAQSQLGATSGSVTADGNGGAKSFRFYELEGATLASVTVTSNDSNGFAVGEFGIKVGP